MGAADLHFDPEFELWVVRPFRVVPEVLSLPTYRLASDVERLAAAAERRWPGAQWTAVPFDVREPVPPVIEEARRGFVRGRPPLGTDSGAALGPLVGPGGPFEVVGFDSSVWLLDESVGAAEARVSLRVRDPVRWSPAADEGAALLDAANSLAEAVKGGGFLAALAGGADPSDRGDAEGGGSSLWYLAALVFHRRPHGAVPAASAAFADVVAGFTGETREPEPTPRWPGLASLHDGFGGQIAVLDAAHEGAGAVRARVLWLWRLVTLHVAHLWSVNRGLTRRTASLLQATRRPADALEAIRREGVKTEVLLREASPVAVSADTLDEAVYGRVWRRWKGEAVTAEVKDQLEFQQEWFDQTASLLASRQQTRMAWILFLLNLTAFSTAIATLITTYDFKNDVFGPDARIRLILAGTSLLVFLALGVVFLRMPRLRRRRSRSAGGVGPRASS